MEVIQFRKMLAEVSKGVKEHELAAMKFMCKDFIPKRKLEEIKSALHLWEALEERELLGVYNTRFLKELLQTSGEGRTDLLRIVQCFDGLPVCGPAIANNAVPGQMSQGEWRQDTNALCTRNRTDHTVFGVMAG